MIRKLLVLSIILFSLIWFGSAYIIKSKVALQIENLKLSNIDISYERIDVTGFPGIWRVKIKEPKLKIVSHSSHKDISTKEIECTFDLSFKKAKVLIKDKIKQEQEFGQQKTYYYLNSAEPILVTLKFNKPFYKLNSKDTIHKVLKVFDLRAASLYGTFEEEKIFDINDLIISLSKTSSAAQQDIALKVHGIYNGQNYLLGFNSAHLSLDSLFSSINNADSTEGALTQIFKVSQFNLNIDEGLADLSLNGKVENSSDKQPEGQLFICLSNYSKIIDSLIHQNFIIPKSRLKEMIATAIGEGKLDDNSVNNNDAGSTKTNIAFEIHFSQGKVKIGEVDLFNINKADSEALNDIDN